MSARWREHNLQTDVITESSLGHEQAWSGDNDFMIGASMPGPRESWFNDSQNYPHMGTEVGIIRDNIDWEVGGEPGLTKDVYSLGVVESTNVDAHYLMGEMTYIRRMPDTNYGPVTGTDENALLAYLYVMQETSGYFPREVSQGDLVKAV